MIVAAPPIAAKRWARGGRDTREEILDAAEDLLQRRGFNGFAYQHIAVQLGIRNAAIHYHFASKEILGVALVKRYRQRFRDWSEQIGKQACAWQRLAAHLQRYSDFLLDAQSKISPVGILGAEYEAIPEEMRHEALLLVREVFEWMVETLELGREQGSIAFRGESRDKAVQISATLQGALQIGRMAGTERCCQVMKQIALELRVPLMPIQPASIQARRSST